MIEPTKGLLIALGPAQSSANLTWYMYAWNMYQCCLELWAEPNTENMAQFSLVPQMHASFWLFCSQSCSIRFQASNTCPLWSQGSSPSAILSQSECHQDQKLLHQVDSLRVGRLPKLPLASQVQQLSSLRELSDERPSHKSASWMPKEQLGCTLFYLRKVIHPCFASFRACQLHVKWVTITGLVLEL